MGSYISKSIGGGVMKNMKEQQETMMERQIALQNEMRQRAMATQISFTREMFLWYGSFYALASVALIAGFLKTKKPAFVGPLLPLTFIIGYQADLAYGTKLTRVRADAENILRNEASLLELPLGRPTIELIDSKRDLPNKKPSPE